MQEFTSCTQAMLACMDNQAFSIAHLYKEETTLDMHIHGCYELYYSISGGRQFLIDNKLYSIAPGDLFFINQYESHKLTDVETDTHERIILYFHPSFTKKLSTANADLDRCFSLHPAAFRHKVSLDKEAQKKFLYFVDKITSAEGFGSDIIEQATIMELLVMLNILCDNNAAEKVGPAYKFNHHVDNILSYINQNITQDITVEQLAGHFFMSPSYLCRVFKNATGTTINKYITARRITMAKSLLGSGVSVNEVFERSGFTDYSNFYKSFRKLVGISPKKYAVLSQSM